jgi:hypothetical protein
MSDIQVLTSDAGQRFDEAVDRAFEDAQRRLLRYHLLRLTVVGLAREEVPLIVELARSAFDDADVADRLRAITDRPDASVLASAIAGVVERIRTGSPFAPRGDVVVGAVVGAYAAMKDAGRGNREDATAAAVLGAVGGGAAVSVGRFIQDQIAAVGVPAYLATPDPA